MAFQEIPAISVLDGNIVLARENKYETLTIDNKVPNTLDLIELITENYPKIYLMDIKAITTGNAQIKFIKKLSEFCEVWLEAGIKDSESIFDLFVAGAQEVVLSSKTLVDFLELAKAHELSENLIFELDFLEGIVSPSGQLRAMKTDQLGEEVLDLGMNKVIFADLGRIEATKPIEQNVIQKLTKLGLEIYVGGGIKLYDTPLLQKLGAKGSIVELTDILQHGKVDF
jgi:uncharacterized protein related to proFAR isomerase